MSTTRIDEQRIRVLNQGALKKGNYVLYWMQQSQRAEQNPALEYAIQQANDLGKRLLVGFGLMDAYPEANRRHYVFMLEGLADVARRLKQRRIKFVIQRGSPERVALRLGQDSLMIICDRGYLRHQKAWRARVAKEAKCRVVQIEGDAVVPVDEVSEKAEFAARTIRPKINELRDAFLADLQTTAIKKNSLNLSVESLDVDGPAKRKRLLDSLNLDTGVRAIDRLFRGGTSAGKSVFSRFLRDSLRSYDDNRNQPQLDDVSHMSMYLHFGQISPVWLAGQIARTRFGKAGDREAYLEELVVRRGLAQNFVEFTPNYDKFVCLPAWARRTLAEHAADRRPHKYTLRTLEDAETHDAYWNAAMREMRFTGYMHNHMRMYWGKKILEWSPSPQQAFQAALTLNNRYFIDGRDPNSYANVAWVFGLHDRPWTERGIFGKVRYMNANGLQRKCNPDAYVRKVDDVVAEVCG
jgi:deoxyribodipyrimidine photo-lyase